MMRTLFERVGAACLLLCFAVIAHAQQANNLKGIGRATISCEISKDLVGAGVSKEAILTSVELRLRSAGLKVNDAQSSPADINSAPDAQLNLISLDVAVNGMKVEDTRLYCYNIQMNATEAASLLHDHSSYVSVITWSKGKMGYAGKSRMDSIETGADELADAFVSDYERANLKSSPVGP